MNQSEILQKKNYFLIPLVTNQFLSDISKTLINASLTKIVNTNKPEKKLDQEVGGDEKKIN
jgi:hypothetical protein